MNLFYGRIDRKTFLVGMGLTGFFTGVLAFIFILPLAAIELIVPNFRDGGPAFLDKIVLIIPVIFFVTASLSLIIRRAHDIASDGLVWLVAFFLSLVARILFDNVLASLLPFIVFGVLAARAGSPAGNRYGRKPAKNFKLENTYNIQKAKHVL